jgi:hypothetical protein
MFPRATAISSSAGNSEFEREIPGTFDCDSG